MTTKRAPAPPAARPAYKNDDRRCDDATVRQKFSSFGRRSNQNAKPPSQWRSGGSGNQVSSKLVEEDRGERGGGGGAESECVRERKRGGERGGGTPR